MIEAWSESQIKFQLEELQESINAIEYENGMYSDFLRREQGHLEIALMTEEEAGNVVGQFLTNLNDLQSVVATLLEKRHENKNPSKGGARKPKKTDRLTGPGEAVFVGLNRISTEHKCIVANLEADEVEQNMNDICLSTEKELDNYQAIIEGLELKCKDINKSECDFEREMKSSMNERTQKYQYEKLQRYFEEKDRAKDGLMKKLRLKTESTAIQKRKVQQQLRQKAEVMGVEVLHEVDWDQIEIENKQYLQKMDDKNVELLALKQKAATTTGLLNRRKRQMQELTENSKVTKEEIDSRIEAVERLQEECRRVIEEVTTARQNLARLDKKIHNYDVPPPKAYIQEKTKLDELRQQIKTWERKVEIAEMKLRSVKTNWRILCAKQNQGGGDSNNSQMLSQSSGSNKVAFSHGK